MSKHRRHRWPLEVKLLVWGGVCTLLAVLAQHLV